jgi:hypothetical protein
MAVLGDDGRRLELDDREGDALAVHRPRDDAIPDAEGLGGGDVVEETDASRLAVVQGLCSVKIRDLRPDEVEFLREMLYAALDWRPDVELPPAELILEHPQVAPFHTGWGRAGDVGLVAERHGALLGLAWYRFFTGEEHGEGFVNEATPEVAVAVVGNTAARVSAPRSWTRSMRAHATRASRASR